MLNVLEVDQKWSCSKATEESVYSREEAHRLFAVFVCPPLAALDQQYDLSNGEKKGKKILERGCSQSANTTKKSWGCTFASLAKKHTVSWCLLTEQIPQKCGCHPLHNHPAFSSWIFIHLINTQVGKQNILKETAITRKDNECEKSRDKGDDARKHMVTAGKS